MTRKSTPKQFSAYLVTWSDEPAMPVAHRGREVTPTEAAALLTICAAYDNRKPDVDAAKAWAMALDGHRFEDCRDAVVAHYRTRRDWIMPSDVLAAVKRVRAGRIEDVAPTPPADLDPDDTGAYSHWLRTSRRAIADGTDWLNQSYNSTHRIGELRHVLRSVPAIEAKPREKTSEHEAGMKRARAELDNHPARLAAIEAQHPAPSMQEPASPEHEETA